MIMSNVDQGDWCYGHCEGCTTYNCDSYESEPLIRLEDVDYRGGGLMSRRGAGASDEEERGAA